MEEVWKPISGYEGIYEVSNTGKARSIDRIDNLGRFKKGVELKLRINTNPVDEADDSWYVRLSKNGRVRDLDFNRIYSATFHRKLPIPPPQKGLKQSLSQND